MRLNGCKIRRFNFNKVILSTFLLLFLVWAFVRTKLKEHNGVIRKSRITDDTRQSSSDLNWSDVANQTKIKIDKQAINSTEIKKLEDKNEITDISLNPETALSLKSTTGLTQMLQSTIQKAYLIENPDLCSSVKDLKVLVIVHSATSNFEKRQVIRQTWTNNSYYPDLGTVRRLFLLGRTIDKEKQSRIEQEFKNYTDILQGDFVDSYHNITLKGVMGYKWISERCRNAKVILKVDDDVIINMFSFLTTYVSTILSKSNHILCRRLSNVVIRRNPNGSWYVNPEEFSGKRTYPTFCQGFMASFSNDVIPSLYKSATITPFFWIDDVYLYGLVPKNIPKINYTSLTYGKDIIWGGEDAIQCYSRNMKCKYTVVLIWTDVPNHMEKIWSLMLHNEKRLKTS